MPAAEAVPLHPTNDEKTVYVVYLWGNNDIFFGDIKKGRYLYDDSGNSLFFDSVL